MPIRHVYERVKTRLKVAPNTYEVTLTGGTTIDLPGDAEWQFRKIEVDDTVLIDLEGGPIPGVAYISVFRSHHLVITFGVSSEHLMLAEAK